MSREPKQPREIDVATIHHVKGSGFDRQMVVHRHIVDFPVRNRRKIGNVAAEVEQCMQLHLTFASSKRYSFSKTGSRKERQAEVDRGRVERIHRLFE